MGLYQRGAGLVECMLAMTILVLAATALTALAVKSVWRISMISAHNTSIAHQHWLRSRLSMATPEQYASLTSYVESSFLPSPDYEVMQSFEQLTEVAGALIITSADISTSYRTHVTLSPKPSVDIATGQMQVTVYKPYRHTILPALPVKP